jgi:hypothetical protein
MFGVAIQFHLAIRSRVKRLCVKNPCFICCGIQTKIAAANERWHGKFAMIITSGARVDLSRTKQRNFLNVYFSCNLRLDALWLVHVLLPRQKLGWFTHLISLHMNPKKHWYYLERLLLFGTKITVAYTMLRVRAFYKKGMIFDKSNFKNLVPKS